MKKGTTLQLQLFVATHAIIAIGMPHFNVADPRQIEEETGAGTGRLQSCATCVAKLSRETASGR